MRGESMNMPKDYVRVFHPTADQEWAGRRLNDRPESDSPVVLAFITGCLLGAVVALMVVV